MLNNIIGSIDGMLIKYPYPMLLSLYSIIFVVIFRIYKNCYTVKTAETLLSTTHATLVILMCLKYYRYTSNELYYATFIYVVSTSYYIVDTIINLVYIGGKMGLPFFAHHVISMIILSFLGINANANNAIISGLFLAELSNIPMYITYFLLQHEKTHPSKMLSYLIYIFTIIETIAFTVLRLIIGSYKLIMFYLHGDIPLTIFITGLFIEVVSLIWSHKLWKQVFNPKKMQKID